MADLQLPDTIEIALRPFGTRTVAVHDGFKLYGSLWVIHDNPTGPAQYRCSHVETGRALGQADWSTVDGCRKAAKGILRRLGRDKVQSAINEARKAVADTE